MIHYLIVTLIFFTYFTKSFYFHINLFFNAKMATFILTTNCFSFKKVTIKQNQLNVLIRYYDTTLITFSFFLSLLLNHCFYRGTVIHCMEFPSNISENGSNYDFSDDDSGYVASNSGNSGESSELGYESNNSSIDSRQEFENTVDLESFFNYHEKIKITEKSNYEMFQNIKKYNNKAEIITFFKNALINAPKAELLGHTTLDNINIFFLRSYLDSLQTRLGCISNTDIIDIIQPLLTEALIAAGPVNLPDTVITELNRSDYSINRVFNLTWFDRGGFSDSELSTTENSSLYTSVSGEESLGESDRLSSGNSFDINELIRRSVQSLGELSLWSPTSSVSSYTNIVENLSPSNSEITENAVSSINVNNSTINTDLLNNENTTTSRIRSRSTDSNNSNSSPMNNGSILTNYKRRRF